MSAFSERKDAGVARRKRDPLYWARGRLVAIRPDGARKTFDPEQIWAIRTAEERKEAAEALEALYARLQERGGLPEWFSEPVNGNGDGTHDNGQYAASAD